MNRRSFLKSFLASVALASIPKVVSAAALKASEFVKALPVINVLDGGWHHIAMSRGNNELRSFVDGLQVQDVEGIGVDFVGNEFAISMDPVLPGQPTTPIMNLKFRNSSIEQAFDTSDSNFLATGFIPEIDPNSDFTIEFWAKAPETVVPEQVAGYLDNVRLTVGVERDIASEFEKQKTLAARFSGIPIDTN